MGFEANRRDTFSKRISSLPDQPNMQADDLKAYFDSSPEELRQAFNNLCDALSDLAAATKVGYTPSAAVPAQTVQEAIENVQKQVQNATIGMLPSGCVDEDKLAQDVRDRLNTIEKSVEAETKARDEADSGLSKDVEKVKTTVSTKVGCYFGSYTGDGNETRTIKLGYTPTAILVLRDGYYTGYNSAIYGGLASADVPLLYGDRNGLCPVEGGFDILNSRNCALNLNGYKYTFAAFV